MDIGGAEQKINTFGSAAVRLLLKILEPIQTFERPICPTLELLLMKVGFKKKMGRVREKAKEQEDAMFWVDGN